MAVRLAAVTGATVHLVWAVEPPIAYTQMHVYSGYLAEELRAAAAYLDAVHRQTTGDSVHLQAQQRVGGAVFALLQYERAADID